MNDRKIFWGLLLIIVGIMLGLSSFGLIDWAFWYFFLPRFWPVLLIALGIFILAGRSRISLGLVLLLIAGTVVAGIWFWGNHDGKKKEKHSVTCAEKLLVPTGVDVVNLELDFGAGALSLEGNAERQMTIMCSGIFPPPEIKSLIRGNRAKYLIKQAPACFTNFSSNKLNRKCSVSLPQDIVWDVDLELGASRADLDFRDIDLKSLDLETGAGDVTIRLGEREMETKLNVGAGASKIEVIVPDSMELDIELDGGLLSTNLENQGLTKKGNHYVTEDISSSRMILSFSGGASRFELKRQPATERF